MVLELRKSSLIPFGSNVPGFQLQKLGLQIRQRRN